MANPYDKEQIRMSEATAQKEAFDLYHEVRETKGDYMKEHDMFFHRRQSHHDGGGYGETY